MKFLSNLFGYAVSPLKAATAYFMAPESGYGQFVNSVSHFAKTAWNRSKTAVFGVSAMGFTAMANATSVLATADKTAITGGFQNFQDTVLDILSVSWAPFLAIVAVLAAPAIVKKMISLAKG